MKTNEADLQVRDIHIVKKRGVKHLRISIKADGTCRVVVPFRVPLALAERFVREQRAWIEAKQKEVQERAGKMLRLPGIRPFQEVQRQALCFTTQQVEEINRFYGFSYAKVSVRNQKTRWGSCSKRGSLSFNYRIMYLPKHLVEYLIVHELCHLKEMHHKAGFWKLVSQTVPDYKERRQQLRNISFL